MLYTNDFALPPNVDSHAYKELIVGIVLIIVTMYKTDGSFNSLVFYLFP